MPLCARLSIWRPPICEAVEERRLCHVSRMLSGARVRDMRNARPRRRFSHCFGVLLLYMSCRPNSWEQLVGRQLASSRRHVMCVSPETGASSSSTPPKVSAHTTRKLQLVIPVYSNNNNNEIKNAANHISDTTTFREHHHLGDENAPARSLSPYHVMHPKFNGTVHFNNFYLFHCFTYFPASACQTISCSHDCPAPRHYTPNFQVFAFFFRSSSARP